MGEKKQKFDYADIQDLIKREVEIRNQYKDETLDKLMKYHFILQRKIVNENETGPSVVITFMLAYLTLSVSTILGSYINELAKEFGVYMGVALIFALVIFVLCVWGVGYIIHRKKANELSFEKFILERMIEERQKYQQVNPNEHYISLQ